MANWRDSHQLAVELAFLHFCLFAIYVCLFIQGIMETTGALVSTLKVKTLTDIGM